MVNTFDLIVIVIVIVRLDAQDIQCHKSSESEGRRGPHASYSIQFVLSTRQSNYFSARGLLWAPDSLHTRPLSITVKLNPTSNRICLRGPAGGEWQVPDTMGLAGLFLLVSTLAQGISHYC